MWNKFKSLLKLNKKQENPRQNRPIIEKRNIKIIYKNILITKKITKAFLDKYSKKIKEATKIKIKIQNSKIALFLHSNEIKNKKKKIEFFLFSISLLDLKPGSILREIVYIKNWEHLLPTELQFIKNIKKHYVEAIIIKYDDGSVKMIFQNITTIREELPINQNIKSLGENSHESHEKESGSGNLNYIIQISKKDIIEKNINLNNNFIFINNKKIIDIFNNPDLKKNIQNSFNSSVYKNVYKEIPTDKEKTEFDNAFQFFLHYKHPKLDNISDSKQDLYFKYLQRQIVNGVTKEEENFVNDTSNSLAKSPNNIKYLEAMYKNNKKITKITKQLDYNKQQIIKPFDDIDDLEK
jgi:hypothetical protein